MTLYIGDIMDLFFLFEELNVMQYVLILPGDHQCMVGIKMAMFDYQRLIGMCYR
jgi:hypothetical protein